MNFSEASVFHLLLQYFITRSVTYIAHHLSHFSSASLTGHSSFKQVSAVLAKPSVLSLFNRIDNASDFLNSSQNFRVTDFSVQLIFSFSTTTTNYNSIFHQAISQEVQQILS